MTRQTEDEVERLISDHVTACEEHERLFRANDNGSACDEQVSAAIGPINDTLEALCRARPSSPEARERRRSYLSAEIVPYVDGVPEMMQRVVDALLAEPGDIDEPVHDLIAGGPA